MISTKLFPWYVAQARREFVRLALIPLNFSTDFWTTWLAVYRPGE